MPTLTIAQLTTPLTRQEVQASIYSVLATLGVNTTGWKSGAVMRTFIVATSAVLAAFSSLMADVARSGFLEYSSGSWLTLVARHVYGVERIVASFATGEIELDNPGGGSFTFEPGDLIVANTVTGRTYRNVATFSLGAVSSETVDVVAVEAGTISNALPHEITTLVTALVGGVTVDNTIGMTAVDDEGDASLRLRCQERLGALSPMGPWDAYSSAVRNAKRADGQAVAINRVRVTKDGFGNVYVYVASADGLVTGDDLALATTAVEQWAEPLSVTSHVIAATPKLIHVTGDAWVYNTTGLTDGQVETAYELRLQEFCASQPVGGNVIGSDPGKVFVDAIRAAIAAAVAPQTFHVVLTVPAGDTELLPNEVATVGTVTITVHQVAPPEGYVA